eukprot:477409-Alexandrium_andersonii.AAC.1
MDVRVVTRPVRTSVGSTHGAEAVSACADTLPWSAVGVACPCRVALALENDWGLVLKGFVYFAG